MKFLNPILPCLWFASVIFSTRLLAAPQSDQDAAKIVTGWLAKTPTPLGAPLKGSRQPATAFYNAAGEVIYYVVPLSPEGFVVTSPDSDLEPIIAFSAVGSFEPDPESPLFAMLQRDLPERLEQARGKAGANARAMSSAQSKWARLAQVGAPVMAESGIPSVDDLRVASFVQSRWDQWSIWNGTTWVACYNYYTPPYASGARSNYVCGCNNTAWAQIMRYYNYPTQSVGTAMFGISVDGVSTNRQLRGGDGAGGPYAWNQMVYVPGAATTEQQRQAIGALTADIGVAAGTSYAAGGSGAWLDSGTLRNVFFYANAIYGPGLDDQFANRVHPNLDAKFPVFLGISGDGSHAVVCDGYGYNVGTLYHHLNMGWSGSYDAWYNLPTVDGGYHFTTVDAYYYNIYPAGTGEIISGRVTDTGGTPITSVSIQADAGGQTYSAQTDSRGIFALPKLPSGTTFTVTATKAGYQFAPWVVATGYSDDYGSSGNRWAVNFVGTQNSGVRIICGSVTNYAGIGVSGVTISFSNGGGNVNTDASGRFFNTVPAGWSGTVTPTKTQYAFIPASRSYANVTTNLGNQDFLGTMVVYVRKSATGANNGTSWANAFPDLTTALAQAPANSELWVAQGVYYPGTARTNTFRCKYSVNVFGGFAGIETARDQRDWNAHVTVLSGDIGVAGDNSDNVYHVVSVAAQSRVDGFKVTGGNANGPGWDDQMGGAFYTFFTQPGFTAANCFIAGNSAANSGGGVFMARAMDSVLTNNSANYGGAAYYSSLVNCLVVSNTASQNGAGVFQGTAFNCTFLGNSAANYGGAACYSTALNCTFAGNSAVNYGGAAYETMLTNCLIVSNRAAAYGGGTFYGTNLNCTLVGNWARYFGGGMYSGSAINCILTGNLADFGNPNYSSSSLAYCCTTPLPGGPGNLSSDPRLRDVAHGDFRPLPGSPVINAGLNQDWMTGTADRAGQPRIADNVVDMGAYEIALPELRLRNPTRSGASFSLEVATLVGKTYYLEYKNDLLAPAWTALPGVAGDGTTKVLTDTNATGARRFYRVRME
jgi:hypothetical protein